MAFSLFSTPQQTPSLFQQQPQQQSSPFWPQQQQQQPQVFQPQQQPQQQQLFQPQQQPQQQQLFQPQQHFQLLQQQQQPQMTTQQQQQQLYLFTNEKAPASYGTKWAELHPDSQKILLQIEEKILEYRDESQRLDQCSRLYDSSVSSDGFEHDASHIIQELGGTTTAMEQQKALLQELMTFVKEMLRNTEMAIRSFMILRQRYVLSSTGTTSIPTAPPQTPGTASQQAASIVPVFDFYNGLPKKPSPFLLQTMARFEKYLVVCRQWIEELEQLLLLDSDRNVASFGSSLVESLPRVMSNVHDFFVHVAAKVESIHQYIESMKSAYLADQRRRGDSNDPFLEADRREAARQEAAARRAHPTLHLPPVPQPSKQIASLISSSSAPATSGASQSSGAALSVTSGSGFSSLFTAPTSSPAMPLSLFSTPSTFAPVSSLFGTTASAVATPQTALFSASSSSLFGSASAPSLFGTPAPSFGSTPPTGSSLFSTPFASGAATGSGASFGAIKSSRPKSRTTRR